MSSSESSDHYRLIVVQLSPRSRVIDDGDRQWILQRRDTGSSPRPWRGISFHQDRDALIRTICGPAPDALAELPARYPTATAIKTPAEQIAAWIIRTRLAGPITNSGELGLLVSAEIAADEVNYAGVVAFEVTPYWISLALEIEDIAPFPNWAEVNCALRAAREKRTATWTKAELAELGPVLRPFVGG